jgi:hypothetical protein
MAANTNKDKVISRCCPSMIEKLFLSPSTLMPYNKLTLNRNNKVKFKTLTEDLAPLKRRNLTKTDKLMSNCFVRYYEHLIVSIFESRLSYQCQR